MEKRVTEFALKRNRRVKRPLKDPNSDGGHRRNQLADENIAGIMYAETHPLESDDRGEGHEGHAERGKRQRVA